MDDLNEFQTRKQKIDVLLREQGWDVKDRSKVVLEVDTRQSDFSKQDYKQVHETFPNEAESRYADYLLLDSLGKPLAVIEAKRTSKDPSLGQKQAVPLNLFSGSQAHFLNTIKKVSGALTGRKAGFFVTEMKYLKSEIRTGF